MIEEYYKNPQNFLIFVAEGTSPDDITDQIEELHHGEGWALIGPIMPYFDPDTNSIWYAATMITRKESVNE